MDPPVTIALSPIQREDIPPLANIYMYTHILDAAMKLNHPTPQQYIQSATSTLESLLENPAYCLIKSVDIATGTIAAWACWVTVTPSEAETPSETGPKLEAAGFSAFVRLEINKMLDEFTSGKKYMRCMACFTHPEFQGRGMGKAMVKYGNEIADRERLPTYLLASPAGFPLYQKFGFETLQNLDVDLREWVKGDDKGYGNYSFRFMLRLPESVPEV